MRAALLLVVVTGSACGRISFDPSSLRGDATNDGSAPVTCPAGYQRLGASCYRLVSGQLPAPVWIEAELACEADGSGAHLVVIDDAVEATLVRDLVTASIADSYIGATDLVTEGVYLTVTGMPQTYLMWPANEPDGNAQDCMTLDSNALVQDTDCGNANDDYVCEYDGVPADPASYDGGD